MKKITILDISPCIFYPAFSNHKLGLTPIMLLGKYKHYYSPVDYLILSKTRFYFSSKSFML